MLPTLAALLLAAPAAEAVLLANRNAYHFSETVPVALVGLKKGKDAKLEFRHRTKGFTPFIVPVTALVDSPEISLPPNLLAPGEYDLVLDGKKQASFYIGHGVNQSRLFLSQTVGNPKQAGGNFILGNAFGFGLLGPDGLPLKEVRGRRSGGLEVFEKAIRDEMPTLVYMYWTGYVTHKPFGSEKSWAADDMRDATRLLSLHTAQRLRRYSPNIISVGTLDEPGLSWGKTPAGGMASGFPNWDETGWYAKRGWKYTQGPASRDDADWMKYMTVRCAIMKEVNAQAKKDLKTIWPEVVFSTDLYAPQAIMDGTDPLNQQINDIPSSHVFLDWGVGKLGALSGLYLEKADDPRRKIAHAMNGQLFGKTVPQPGQRNAYRVMLNAMIAAGLKSNWWLNPTGMKNEDLAWANEPGLRLGSLFSAFGPNHHDVAVLWSFTEAAMRQKDVSAREAKKKAGEQIKLMIASLPDVPGAKDKLVDINAYNVGGNYKEQVLTAHQALTRAGYPAHILHERVLADQLKRYKTLVMVGQTFELPASVRKTIADWQAKGGQVVVDGTTKVKFEGAIATRADFRGPAFRWGAFFGPAEKKPHPFKNDREASFYHTNFFMDELARKAVAPMREAMKKTASKPAIVTDDIHLAAERHTTPGGKQKLILVLNAFEKLPAIPEKERYDLYNYAAHEASFTLQGIGPRDRVWVIEGGDWKSAKPLAEPTKPQKARFEPGEMKVYLVLPAEAQPKLGSFTALRRRKGGELEVMAATEGGKEPSVLPFTLTISAPGGRELYKVYRATDEKGEFAERFPVGVNAPNGSYKVVLQPLLEKGKQQVQTAWAPFDLPLKTNFKPEPANVFDSPAIQKWLATKPAVKVVASDKFKDQAAKLAKDLGALGVKASVVPATEAIRKVAYPRVWNPFAQVFRPIKAVRKAPGPVKAEVTVNVAKDGTVKVTKGGKEFTGDWNQPETSVTIAGEGWVDFSGDRELCYEPGVQFYIDARRQRTVLNASAKEEKTTAEFRAKWAKPWQRLTTHVGAYQLPPQLPEAYWADSHLVILGDNLVSQAIQAAELLPRVVDARYPAPGRGVVQFAWGPFSPDHHAVLIGANDDKGAEAGAKALLALIRK